MTPDYKDPQFIVTALTAIAANIVAILVYRGILNAEEANISLGHCSRPFWYWWYPWRPSGWGRAT